MIIRASTLLPTVRQVFIALSRDNGATWSDPVPVPGSDGLVGDPQIAAGPDGIWGVAWNRDRSVEVCVSKDVLASWNDVIVLAASSESEDNSSPRLGTDRNGTWGISYVRDDYSLRDEHPVRLFFRWSTDNGTTWEKEQLVDTIQTDGPPTTSMAVNDQGDWVNLLATEDGDILRVCTSDDALHWGAPKTLVFSANLDIPHPVLPDVSVDIDEQGQWLCLFSAVIHPELNVWTVFSTGVSSQ
jgi:hypothetical protein